MNIHNFFLVVLFFGSFCDLRAKDKEPISSEQSAENIKEFLSKETITTIVKYVSVDVLVIPEDNHVMVADPVTLSLSKERLDLKVTSTKWPNAYPGDMFDGLATSAATFNSPFKIAHLEDMNTSVLSYQNEDLQEANAPIEKWTPLALGSVTIEYYGDLVVKEGSLLQKQKIRHVVVQVPVTVVE